MPRHRAKERACEKAIKKTLAYRSTFRYPLSFHQLATYLISKKKYDYNFFSKQLRRLTKNKSVGVKKRKYYLPKIKPVSWSARAKNTKKLIKDNLLIFKILKKIPWILLLGVTGSAGAYNAEKNSDVDIFVITAKNRLWITRGFIFLLLKITRKYPRKFQDKGKICPNIYIDETRLAWPKKKRSIYIANEIALMQPFINRNDMYFKFIKANDWVFKHLNNFKVNIPKNLQIKPSARSSKLVDFFEKVAMSGQLWYMKKRQTTEITTKNFIHFKKKDDTQRVLADYKRFLKKS